MALILATWKNCAYIVHTYVQKHDTCHAFGRCVILLVDVSRLPLVLVVVSCLSLFLSAKDGYTRRILLILPDNHVNEDTVDKTDDGSDFDDDDETIKEPVFYSNCSFSNVNGNESFDGHLESAISLEVDNDQTNFFMWGNQKGVPTTAGYAVYQIALDGTQEILTYKAPNKTTANDPDAWQEARKKAIEAKKKKKKG